MDIVLDDCLRHWNEFSGYLPPGVRFIGDFIDNDWSSNTKALGTVEQLCRF